MAIDVRIADDMRGKTGLRIEPVGLALNGKTGLPKRVDRFDEDWRSSAAKIEKGLTRTEHRKILLLAMLRHQRRELAGERELVADNLGRMDGDRPGIDRPGEGLTVAVDDV